MVETTSVISDNMSHSIEKIENVLAVENVENVVSYNSHRKTHEQIRDSTINEMNRAIKHDHSLDSVIQRSERSSSQQFSAELLSQTFSAESVDICQVVRSDRPPMEPMCMELNCDGFETVRTKRTTMKTCIKKLTEERKNMIDEGKQIGVTYSTYHKAHQQIVTSRKQKLLSLRTIVEDDKYFTLEMEEQKNDIAYSYRFGDMTDDKNKNKISMSFFRGIGRRANSDDLTTSSSNENLSFDEDELAYRKQGSSIMTLNDIFITYTESTNHNSRADDGQLSMASDESKDNTSTLKDKYQLSSGGSDDENKYDKYTTYNEKHDEYYDDNENKYDKYTAYDEKHDKYYDDNENKFDKYIAYDENCNEYDDITVAENKCDKYTSYDEKCDECVDNGVIENKCDKYRSYSEIVDECDDNGVIESRDEPSNDYRQTPVYGFTKYYDGRSQSHYIVDKYMYPNNQEFKNKGYYDNNDLWRESSSGKLKTKFTREIFIIKLSCPHYLKKIGHEKLRCITKEIDT